MDGTILSQGSFTVGAVVVPQYIAVPSGTDWISTYNFTQSYVVGGATPNSIENYWQLGMAPGYSYVKYYTDASAVLNGDLLTTGGISIYDPSGNNPYALPLIGNPIATTASTNAVQPVVSTGNTGTLTVGSIVRLSATAQTDINGIDFVVGAVNPGVSFTLLTATNTLANVPGAIGGAGFYRQINTLTPMFYPSTRYITNITQAAQAQISLSVPHNMCAGQEIRIHIPAVSGMVQLDGLAVTITSVVDAYNIIVGVNTTGFTAFTFPTIAQQPSSFPIIGPVGEYTANALVNMQNQFPLLLNGQQVPNTQSGILSDSLVNTGFLGVILGTGGLGYISGAATTGPAGTAAGDVIFWRAGKSSFGGQ
jgi:hypothetical protein